MNDFDTILKKRVRNEIRFLFLSTCIKIPDIIRTRKSINYEF